ncbi:hypothetical protein AGMMS49573_06700 [Endomicrobiia bacterium]|nr:hypothetical protein AGMMS49523_10460 [Endomicrobiia bacterium]GHT08361.1 hypothetical protein AGMMS49532_03220 [Endomicrobiia bacterium]GHT11398.1 hypothetical protein AGMMS49571_01620 [Endomicrobiia bacterium]GHT16589.1 hypothetical protein AGMMS49573_06700 [Endomicrobiia bacterium]GHT20421.1 hypothetical protein AGMMS49929_06930 [Endomicrobiia bacterium]
MLFPLYTLKNTLFFSCTAGKIKYKKLDIKIIPEKINFFLFSKYPMQNMKRKNSRSCITDGFGINTTANLIFPKNIVTDKTNLRSSERINEHNAAAL